MSNILEHIETPTQCLGSQLFHIGFYLFIFLSLVYFLLLCLLILKGGLDSGWNNNNNKQTKTKTKNMKTCMID